jgi:hypothetical protein
MGKKKQFVHSSGLVAFSDGMLSILVTIGYFKREQEKICKRMDTDVAFTWEYSKVLISTGNVKCARRIRNVQGKGNYRVERDFRVF